MEKFPVFLHASKRLSITKSIIFSCHFKPGVANSKAATRMLEDMHMTLGNPPTGQP